MDKIEIVARAVENQRRARIGLPSKSSPLISAQVFAEMETALKALSDAGYINVAMKGLKDIQELLEAGMFDEGLAALTAMIAAGEGNE